MYVEDGVLVVHQVVLDGHIAPDGQILGDVGPLVGVERLSSKGILHVQGRGGQGHHVAEVELETLMGPDFIHHAVLVAARLAGEEQGVAGLGGGGEGEALLQLVELFTLRGHGANMVAGHLHDEHGGADAAVVGDVGDEGVLGPVVGVARQVDGGRNMGGGAVRRCVDLWGVGGGQVWFATGGGQTEQHQQREGGGVNHLVG